MARKICAVLLLLLAVAVIVLLVIDYENLKENFPRILVVVLGLIGSFVKLLLPGKKYRAGRKLSYYEKNYSEFIRNAFCEDKSNKKKLLKAMKYYNTDQYDKAEKLLKQLCSVSSSSDERRVTGLFLALNYTDSGYPDRAIEEYEKLIEMRIETATIYNNLGELYKSRGNYEKAEKYFLEAIRISPDYSVSYNNAAHIYFEKGDFEKAKKYAESALSKNVAQVQASNLMAIIYHIEENEEMSEKYYRMSVKNGSDGASLRSAMSFYKRQHDEYGGNDADEENE